MRARALTLAVALLATSAPLRAQGLFDDNEARRRIEALRQQVEANQKAVDQRLSKLEATPGDRNAILDFASQLDAMRNELARMRGQLEVVEHRLDVADQRQKDLYADIDTRLRKLEQAQQSAAAAPAEGAAPGQAAATPQQSAPPTPAETRAYEAALNQFKLGNYALAISAFEGFLVTYPDSQLAPSAQYWIGNAHYAQQEYKSAIIAQQKLLTAWPDNAKAPDAMLNMASSQEALGDRGAARKTLEDLIARYPQSPAALNAKQRLAPSSSR